MANYWNALFYTRADYAGFMIPAAEGGRGPDNARDILGLEIDHHAGMKTVTLQPGESVDAAAYRAMRESHTFLTDDNHTWEVVPGEQAHWMSRLRVIKNEKSGYFARIPGLSWMILEDGPGAHWFTMRFRLATVGMIAAEIEADRVSALEYDAEADACNDSVRGRKRARTARNCAHSARFRGETAPGRRWPEHFLKEKKEA